MGTCYSSRQRDDGDGEEEATKPTRPVSPQSVGTDDIPHRSPCVSFSREWSFSD